MSEAKPSTFAWVTVHLVYPLFPVPLEGVIRWAVLGEFRPHDTFSAATLAMSVGIMSVFINQSLRTQHVTLPDPEDEDMRNAICTIYTISAITFFALFSAVVLMYALVNDRHMATLQPILHFFENIVFLTFLIPNVIAIPTQRSFKLKASFA